MKKRTKIILISITALLIVAAGAAYFIYDQATNYVIANVFESLLMEDLTQQGVVVENGMIVADSTTVSNSTTDAGQVTTEVSGEAASDGTTTAPSENATESAAADPSAAPTTDTNTSSNTNGVSIQERVEEIVRGIPIRDKNAVMRLIMQNVSSNDIRYLAGLVTDGNISSLDIAKAKEVAMRSFDAEQLEEVKYYYYKYIGLFAEFY